MVVITPKDKSVAALTGIHLYHGDISNCSMRVRMALEEKGLDWESHHIDLKKKENLDEGYFAINPNGLVPTMIHEGVVHIESNEIIAYLDEAYPEPPLRPAAHADAIDTWLARAADLHVKAVKPYVYATKMAPKLHKTAEEQELYDSLQTNEELIEFHAKHAGDSQFSAEDVRTAVELLDAAFSDAEEVLNTYDWLSGEKFGLADISWLPIHFVLVGCGYDFDRFPKVMGWIEAARQRRSFQKAILEGCQDFADV